VAQSKVGQFINGAGLILVMYHLRLPVRMDLLH